MANLSCITQIPSALCSVVAGAATRTYNAAKPVVQVCASKVSSLFQKVLPYVTAIFAFATSNVGLSVLLAGATVACFKFAADESIDDFSLVLLLATGILCGASAVSLFTGKGFAATRIAALRASWA